MGESEHFPQTAGKRPQADPPTGVGVVCGTITVTPANRWAAFTDDELHSINDAIFISDQHERERTGQQMGTTPAALSVELQAELERRRS